LFYRAGLLANEGKVFEIASIVQRKNVVFFFIEKNGACERNSEASKKKTKCDYSVTKAAATNKINC